MGQTLHQGSTFTKGAVVYLLAHRVHQIPSNCGTEDNLLYEVFHNGSWIEVTVGDIVCAVRTESKDPKLQEKEIDPDMIGAYLLLAGGYMALKSMGYKDSTIRKFGCWTSDTWQMYIHTQI